MSIETLIEELRQGEHETYPPASPEDIAKTEAAIGHPLPNLYKEFVGRFSSGAYLFPASGGKRGRRRKRDHGDP